jgi:hypothetical protein
MYGMAKLLSIALEACAPPSPPSENLFKIIKVKNLIPEEKLSKILENEKY